MLRLFLILGFLVGGCLAQAAPPKFDSLRVGSEVYSNVTVLGANATDLYFKSDQGISNVKLKYLSPELQRRFGYDPKEAAKAEQEKTKSDARYEGELAAQVAARQARAQAQARAEAVHHDSSPDAIADPVSDLSLIGKPGPTLPNQNWIGDKPELEGKAVLLFFWAPWSLPCKKFLSPMAGFQKEFEGKLQVVGVLGEDTTEARNAAASCGFPSLIDAGGKLVAGAGVSSIPFVLLVNAKGTVLYAGHPAALNEKNLGVVLEKAE